MIEHDSWQCAEYLDFEPWALDHIDATDEGINDEGHTAAIIKGNSIGFTIDPDRSFRAPGNKDRMTYVSFDFEHAVMVVVIFY